MTGVSAVVFVFAFAMDLVRSGAVASRSNALT
jgi:hypothetical protein